MSKKRKQGQNKFQILPEILREETLGTVNITGAGQGDKC